MAEVAAYVVANAATIAAVAAATTAAASISSANAQSQQMRIQAQQAELQGRQGALQYSNQATQVLERQQQLAAAVRARAASGGVDPFTGSPMTIQQVDAMKAGEEYGMAKDNAQSAIYGGLAQSQSLQSAASTTKRIGYLTAIGNLATAGASYGATKTP
tara:strand:- start:1134 stop:1610 length:477 start_codon:yes stop_codon:yes gene_type:complete